MELRNTSSLRPGVSPSNRYHQCDEVLSHRGKHETIWLARDLESKKNVEWHSIKFPSSLGNNGSNKSMNQVVERLKTLSSLSRETERVLTVHEYWVDRDQKNVCFVCDSVRRRNDVRLLRDFLTKRKVHIRLVKDWCMIYLKLLCLLQDWDKSMVILLDWSQNVYHTEEKMNELIVDLTYLVADSEALNGGCDSKVEASVAARNIDLFGRFLCEIVTRDFEKLSGAEHETKKRLKLILDVQIKNFLKLCFISRKTRPCASELMSHPFFEFDYNHDTLCCRDVCVDVTPAKTGLPFCYDIQSKFNEDSSVQISFRLNKGEKSDGVKVSFVIHPVQETAIEVASEMIKELQIDPDRTDDLVDAIELALSQKESVSRKCATPPPRSVYAESGETPLSSPRSITRSSIRLSSVSDLSVLPSDGATEEDTSRAFVHTDIDDSASAPPASVVYQMPLMNEQQPVKPQQTNKSSSCVNGGPQSCTESDGDETLESLVQKKKELMRLRVYEEESKLQQKSSAKFGKDLHSASIAEQIAYLNRKIESMKSKQNGRVSPSESVKQGNVKPVKRSVSPPYQDSDGGSTPPQRGLPPPPKFIYGTKNRSSMSESELLELQQHQHGELVHPNPNHPFHPHIQSATHHVKPVVPPHTGPVRARPDKLRLDSHHSAPLFHKPTTRPRVSPPPPRVPPQRMARPRLHVATESTKRGHPPVEELADEEELPVARAHSNASLMSSVSEDESTEVFGRDGNNKMCIVVRLNLPGQIPFDGNGATQLEKSFAKRLQKRRSQLVEEFDQYCKTQLEIFELQAQISNHDTNSTKFKSDLAHSTRKILGKRTHLLAKYKQTVQDQRELFSLQAGLDGAAVFRIPDRNLSDSICTPRNVPPHNRSFSAGNTPVTTPGGVFAVPSTIPHNRSSSLMGSQSSSPVRSTTPTKEERYAELKRKYEPETLDVIARKKAELNKEYEEFRQKKYLVMQLKIQNELRKEFPDVLREEEFPIPNGTNPHQPPHPPRRPSQSQTYSRLIPQSSGGTTMMNGHHHPHVPQLLHSSSERSLQNQMIQQPQQTQTHPPTHHHSNSSVMNGGGSSR